MQSVVLVRARIRCEAQYRYSHTVNGFVGCKGFACQKEVTEMFQPKQEKKEVWSGKEAAVYNMERLLVGKFLLVLLF